ncbi:hypothetical protein D3C73_1157380 [compost metagenome]
MKLTASGDDECIRAVSFVHTQADIRLKLFEQTLTQLTGSHPLAFFTRERTVVHEEGHLHSRLINLQNRQCFRISGISDRLTDVDVLNPGNSDDVACACFFCLNALQALEAEQLLDPSRLALAVAHNNCYGLALLNDTAVNAADRDTAQIFVVIHQGYKELQRLVNLLGW